MVSTTVPVVRCQRSSVVLGDGRMMVAGQVFRTGVADRGGALSAQRSPDRFLARGIFRTRFPGAAPSSPPVSASRNEPTRWSSPADMVRGRSWSMRLRPQGGLDRSFGSRRVMTTSVGGIGEALALAPGRRHRRRRVQRQRPRPSHDRRSVRGMVDSTSPTAATVWCRACSGIPSPPASAAVSGLVLSRDGRVTASGHLDAIGGDGHGSAGLFRTDGRGRPVRSFGADGHRVVAVPLGRRERPVVPVRAGPRRRWPGHRDRIRALPGEAGSLLSARLTARGRLDRAFGSAGDGRVVTNGVTGGNTTLCGAGEGTRRWDPGGCRSVARGADRRGRLIGP